MSPAEVWLRSHTDGVPRALTERMLQVLPDHAGSIPDALLRGALELYAAVARGSGGREDALPLLAADALFTHAFEAQAEIDPARIDDLVTTCERGLGAIAPS